MQSVSDAHPDGATSADLWGRETSLGKGSPPVTGRLAWVDDLRLR